MYDKLFFSRLSALGIALIIFVYSCGYVAFCNEKLTAQHNKAFQLAVLKSKPNLFFKIFLKHPRLAVNKRAVGIAAAFIFLHLFFGFKTTDALLSPCLNQSYGANNRVLLLHMWRI